MVRGLPSTMTSARQRSSPSAGGTASTVATKGSSTIAIGGMAWPLRTKRTLLPAGAPVTVALKVTASSVVMVSPSSTLSLRSSTMGSPGPCSLTTVRPAAMPASSAGVLSSSAKIMVVGSPTGLSKVPRSTPARWSSLPPIAARWRPSPQSWSQKAMLSSVKNLPALSRPPVATSTAASSIGISCFQAQPMHTSPRSRAGWLIESRAPWAA